MPFQRYTQVGVLALGAYFAIVSNNPVEIGSLFGFMMLGGRVAGPARLDGQHHGGPATRPGIDRPSRSVLNRPTRSAP